MALLKHIDAGEALGRGHQRLLHGRGVDYVGAVTHARGEQRYGTCLFKKKIKVLENKDLLTYTIKIE